jgi:hypothetical protein
MSNGYLADMEKLLIAIGAEQIKIGGGVGRAAF